MCDVGAGPVAPRWPPRAGTARAPCQSTSVTASWREEGRAVRRPAVAARVPFPGVGQAVGRSGVRPGAIRGWTRGHGDAAIALFVGGALAVQRIAAGAVPAAYTVSAVLAILAIAGGLTLRRRAPLTGYLVGSAGLMIDATTPDPLWLAPYANLFGLYSLALYATRRRAWVGLVFMLLFVVGYFAAAGGKAGLESDAKTGATIVLSWLALWTIGYSTARRREEQQVARHLLRRQAVGGERPRIPRGLHDLIGHTLHVMLLQAGGGPRGGSWGPPA